MIPSLRLSTSLATSLTTSLAVSALGLLTASTLGLPAIAQSVSVSQPSAIEPPAVEPPAVEQNDPALTLPAPEPLVQPDETAEVTHYADAAIALDYPATWKIQVADGKITIGNVPETAENEIETQIFQIASPPGPVVSANIDSFIAEGSAVGRYRTVTLDGQEALVMWLSDRPNELPSAIATFIGYGNQTVLLFSRYSPTNEGAEAEILRLHSSFTNLAFTPPATATPPSSEVSQ